MTALLQIEGLTKKFGGLTAVNDVSLSVEKGQIYSLIGPNGAGKTTVFNLISSVFKPTAGRILFEGQDLTKLPTYALAKLGIARTFQNLAVFKHETVVNNLLVGMHSHLRTDPLSAPSSGAAPATKRSRRASGSRRSSTSSRSRTSATTRSARCPTASRSGWSSAARWRSRRSSCCSTRWCRA
jgi:ABC-type branched-subunit amino acid transport system ATPase component